MIGPQLNSPRFFLEYDTHGELQSIRLLYGVL